MLIKYEFFKHLNRFNILLVAIMLLLNVGITAYQYRYEFTDEAKNIRETKQHILGLYKNNKSQFNDLYNDYLARKSEYTTQFYSSLTDDRTLPAFKNTIIDYPNYGDEDLFNDIEDILYSADNYKKALYSLLRDAANRIKSADNVDSYTYRYYISIINTYDPLTNITWEPAIVKGWNEFFSLGTPSVVLMLTVYGLFCSVFTVEKHAGTLAILNILKKGKTELTIAKLCYIFFVCFLLTILFTLSPLIVFAFSTGLSSPNMQIQALKGFTYFRYNIKIWQYIIIYIAVRMLIVFWLSLIIANIGQYFNSEAPSLVAIAIIAAIGIFLKNISPVFKYYYLQKYNIFDIVNINILFNQLKGVNLFNYFYDYTYFVITLLIASIIILVLLSLANKKHRLENISENKKTAAIKLPHMTIFSAEFYKLIICNQGIYIVVLCLVIKIITSTLYYYPDFGSLEAVYKDYIEQLRGPITEKKLAYIEDEYNYIYDTINDYSKITSAYYAGEISYSDYQKFMSKYNYATFSKNAFNRVIERRDYLLYVNSTYPNIEFLYEQGINLLLNTPIDIIGIITAILLCSNMFAIEYGTGFYKIMRLSKKGRQPVFWRKIALTVTIALSIFLSFSIIDIYNLLKYYNLDYLNANILSIPNFFDVNISCSILTYTVIYKIISILGYIICFILIAVLSELFKNQVKTIIYTALIIFIPYIVEFYGIKDFRFLSIPYLLSPTNIKTGIAACICCLAITLLLLYISYFRWCESINTPIKFHKTRNRLR